MTTELSETTSNTAMTAVSRNLVRNVHAPFAARRFARTQLLAWGLPGLVDTGELISDELAANAVEHGGGNFISVQLELSRPAVTVKVWDENAARMPVLPDAAATFFDEHGRGLMLTDALSAKWGAYRSAAGGKVVFAVLTRGE